jgi:hypothetical protein
MRHAFIGAAVAALLVLAACTSSLQYSSLPDRQCGVSLCPGGAASR